MQLTAIALSALLLVATASDQGATQYLAAGVAATSQHPDCGYVCVYADSVSAHDLTRQAMVRTQPDQTSTVPSPNWAEQASTVAVSDSQARSRAGF